MASKSQSNVTTDHDQIRSWAEERGAQPSCVRGTGNKGDIGLLRLDFPGYTGEDTLEHISWEDFFEKFDEQNLALLYQETTAGGEKSNFNKLVSRQTAAAVSSGKSRSKSSAKKAPVKSAAKKAPAKKVAAKKSSSAKTAATKSASKSTAKKAASRPATGKKMSAKKVAAKKVAAKNSPAKKAAKRFGR